jgi:hypothetical protein
MKKQTRRRTCYGSFAPVKQQSTDFIFQQLYLLTKSRLNNIYLLCGLSEIERVT